MLTFYLIAGVAALATTALLVRPLLLRRDGAEAPENTDAQVFRDQLAEIERDLARGTIEASEAEGARIEVSRRLLAADARARASSGLKVAPQGHSSLLAGLALIGTPVLAAALYLAVGSPGAQDQPLAERETLVTVLAAAAAGPGRPSQAEAEVQMAQSAVPNAPPQVDPSYAALVERLEATVADRPNDLTGQRLLANARMQLGRYTDAAETYARAIELAGAGADAELHGSHAEAMILSAQGYISPEAEHALAAALRIDPTLPIARYYAGLALRQGGRLDAAIAVWQELRATSAPDAPYLQYLDVLLTETLQARAVPQSGPTQAEIDAANEMTPEERLAAMEGMVAGLEARLLRDGGAPEEWGQLMSSYAVMNRPEDARRAFELALIAYPTGDAHEALRGHAITLGLLGDAPRGPTPEQMQSAEELSPEDRQAMVEGMVAGLEERLTREGGPHEEWLMLIRSYVRLDRIEDAARVFKLADAALAEADDPARGFIKEQALLLGVPVE